MQISVYIGLSNAAERVNNPIEYVEKLIKLFETIEAKKKHKVSLSITIQQ